MRPATPARTREAKTLAILISGGLDSAILLGEVLPLHQTVYPLFVRCGRYWEEAELNHLRHFLEAVRSPALRPLHILDRPVTDVYGSHWSLSGRNVPDGDSADEAVFVPGRNVLLRAKALLWCHLNRVKAVALATLASNPFPDASPAFCDAYQRVVSLAVEGIVEVRRPYAALSKTQVMHRGRDLPLHLTFPCIRPAAGKHCGRCNNCAERRRAFANAGWSNPTEYDPE
jgi:7-cyano-7-deazaguanine synthase